MTMIKDETLLMVLKQTIETKKRNIEGAKQNVQNLENQLHGMQTMYNEVCTVIEQQKDKEKPPKVKDHQLGLPVDRCAPSTTVR